MSTSIYKVTTSQGNLVIKPPKNITNNSSITSILSSSPHIEHEERRPQQRYRWREGKHPVKTFSIMIQGKHKAGSRLPGKLLAVMEQSFR